ncbi:MAG: ATP synthase F1 subunit delta [Candidatus Berkelbacteria bacterium]|nr:ATP synthase F1 subunit delta [Candidatus Berkelbacteria bacterium]
MKFSVRDTARAVYELAEENPSKISQISKELYLYLLKQKRTKLLPFIFEELEKIEKQKKGIKEIEIESARALTDKQKKQISCISKNQKIEFKEKINPDLLGGVILKIEDNVIDGSLKNNLQRLKEEMWQTAVL